MFPRNQCGIQAWRKPPFSRCSVSSPSGRTAGSNYEQLDINLEEHVISDQQLARFAEATKEDEVLSGLQQVILSAWPESTGQVPLKA